MSKAALIGLTITVLVAFATNSVLGRAALKSSDTQLIDPATYTTVRILFGALVLGAIQWFRRRPDQEAAAPAVSNKDKWLSAMMLTLYAAAFSFAYVELDAASGTLILFAFVQLTMLTVAAIRGERPRPIEIAGLVLAFAGVVYLVAPSFQEFRVARESVLMMLSGIGWGTYSVLGKGSRDPIRDTAGNFLRSVPIVLLVSAFAFPQFVLTNRGFQLAAASGGITSGLGYVLWYVVLPKLRSTQAAAVQVSVPIVAAIGGVIFAGDHITGQSVIAGLLILGGIALTIDWKKA